MASLLRSAAAAARHLRLAHPRRLAAAPPSLVPPSDDVAPPSLFPPSDPPFRFLPTDDVAPSSRYLRRRDGVARHDHLPVNWGFTIVPEKTALVVERFGKYQKTLGPGIHLLLPGADRVAYVHSLKEEVVAMEDQFAITEDKVAVRVGAALRFKVVSPYLASYVVDNPVGAVMYIAESLVKEEFGRMAYNRIPEMNKQMNDTITRMVNKYVEDWGIKCCSCDIRDVFPQAEARELELKDLLVKHGNLLRLIYEVVKKNAEASQDLESFVKSALPKVNKWSVWWPRILMALFQLFTIAMGSAVLAASLFAYLYPEKALELQDRFIEGYANSMRYFLFAGWAGGETLAARNRREAQEKAEAEEQKHLQEEEARKKKEEEAEEQLRRQLQGMTLFRWIVYRVEAGRRRKE